MVVIQKLAGGLIMVGVPERHFSTSLSKFMRGIIDGGSHESLQFYVEEQAEALKQLHGMGIDIVDAMIKAVEEHAKKKRLSERETSLLKMLVSSMGCTLRGAVAPRALSEY